MQVYAQPCPDAIRQVRQSVITEGVGGLLVRGKRWGTPNVRPEQWYIMVHSILSLAAPTIPAPAAALRMRIVAPQPLMMSDVEVPLGVQLGELANAAGVAIEALHPCHLSTTWHRHQRDQTMTLFVMLQAAQTKPSPRPSSLLTRGATATTTLKLQAYSSRWDGRPLRPTGVV